MVHTAAKRRRAIQAIISGAFPLDVAEAEKVSSATVYRWMAVAGVKATQRHRRGRPSEVSRRAVEMREKLGLSYAEIGRRLGKHRSTVHQAVVCWG